MHLCPLDTFLVLFFFDCRILEFRRSPHAIGRYIDLDTEIKPVAMSRLLETFYQRDNNTCFYGKCLYCKGQETGVCADGHILEGVMLLWLPETMTLKRHKHPWSRVYKTQQPAQLVFLRIVQSHIL